MDDGRRGSGHDGHPAGAGRGRADRFRVQNDYRTGLRQFEGELRVIRAFSANGGEFATAPAGC